MGKDPAFLFYSKDWLEGTAEMMPEEKGIYIDLLCYQHQKENLPNETKRLAKLTGLTENGFLKLWNNVRSKFKIIDGNRLINQKLYDVMAERSRHGTMQKIIGTFAAVIRTSKIPYELKQVVKKIFKWEDFKEVPTEQLTERLTIWLQNGLKSIEDGTVVIDGNDNKGGAGGKLTREEELAIYEKFTDAILAHNDHLFEQLAMNERVIITEEAVKDHLALLCRYPNMRPTKPAEFRQSLIKHCKDFKIKTDGNKPKDEFLGTFNLTKARRTMEELRKIDEQERAKNNFGASG